jgi:hypothetical protein
MTLRSRESGWDDMLSRKLARYGINARIRVLIQNLSVIQRDDGRKPIWDNLSLFKLSDLLEKMTQN